MRHHHSPWGRLAHTYLPMPISLSGWDLLLYKLNLKESEAHRHPEVRKYIKDHHRNRFIPAKVLDAMGIDSRFFD